MENAAKALIIAGGILLAIMTLTLLVYGLTTTSRIAEARDAAKKAEDIAKFNMEFEAYNKKRMYGVDVINVINKAVNNNARMDVANPDERYYVNIKFYTIEKFKNEIFVEKIDNKTGKEIDPEDSDNAYRYRNVLNKINVYVNGEEKDLYSLCNLSTGINTGWHELGTIQGEGTMFTSDKNFIDTFTKGTIDNQYGTYKNSNYTYNCTLYSGLTNFKKAIFECKSEQVKYSPETGRIYEMVFEQQKI